MDAPTHKAIAAWTAQHPDLRSFLILSPEEVAWYSVVPDKIDSDNILMGDPDSRWYHSYKIGDDGIWTAGAVDTAIGACGWLAPNSVKEGQFDTARSLLARVAHYLTDCGTPWHVCSTMADTHKDGEEALNVHIGRVLQGMDYTPVELAFPQSLRRSSQQFAHDTWFKIVPQMKGIKAGAELRDMPDLATTILSRCASFTLAIQLAILARILKA